MLKTKESYLQLIESHNLKAKKHFGQNFLVAPDVYESILQASEINKEDFIIEVGPGLGFLTTELAQRAQKIQAFEIDTDIIPLLKENISENKNVQIENIDILKSEIPKADYKVIANIPYYITSPILRHFISESTKLPKILVFMVQKEVAEKVCSLDGKHSILSWQVQLFGKPEIVRNVSKKSFYPAPKVESAILKITPFETPLLPNPHDSLKIMKISFQNKRKQLAKNLSSYLNVNQNEIKEVFKRLGIDENVRAEKLGVEEWRAVFGSELFQ